MRLIGYHRLPFLLVTALFAVLSTIGFAEQNGQDKPNILFIFADDQCFDTINALGNQEVKTPNLDRLVSEGTTFTHCYNMGGWNGAICVASRTMLNTGRYIWHANAVDNKLKGEQGEVAQGRFWSEQMKSAGYRTYMTGKWHVKFDAGQTFDVAEHIRGGMPKQSPEGYNRPIEGEEDKWSPFNPKFGGFWEGGTHWSEVVANDAISYLDDAKPRENPFFMYIAFNAPHDPRQSPQKYVEMYPEQEINIPANFLPLYPYREGIGAGKSLRDEKLAPFPRTEYSVRVNRQEYYAIITHMDAQIGRILDALEKSGKRQNTWIFFTADHGLAVGQHGLLGKQNMYDHSVRVPFIVVGPGVGRGEKKQQEIYLQDVMPTTLQLAGLDIPEHVDFHSLLPLLSGEREKSYYPAIYGGYVNSQRMVRQDGYKLILYPKIKKARLFHVAEDPHEVQDLFNDPATESISKKLFSSLLELQKENGDELDLKAPFPELASG